MVILAPCVNSHWFPGVSGSSPLFRLLAVERILAQMVCSLNEALISERVHDGTSRFTCEGLASQTIHDGGRLD